MFLYLLGLHLGQGKAFSSRWEIYIVAVRLSLISPFDVVLFVAVFLGEGPFFAADFFTPGFVIAAFEVGTSLMSPCGAFRAAPAWDRV